MKHLLLLDEWQVTITHYTEKKRHFALRKWFYNAQCGGFIPNAPQSFPRLLSNRETSHFKICTFFSLVFVRQNILDRQICKIEAYLSLLLLFYKIPKVLNGVHIDHFDTVGFE